MRLRLHLVLGFLISLLVVGCSSSSFIKTNGRVVKGGQPYLAEKGQGLRIFFVPLAAPEGQHYDSYAAMYDPQDGSFEVQGKDGKGMPPGKYRIDLQLMKDKEDLLNGALLGPKSPFTCEIKSGSDEVVIDLDQAKFDTLLAQASKPKKSRAN
jgi:hypothetical protein